MSNAVAKTESSNVPVTDAGQLMQVLSRAASDPNTDIDKMERIMGLYERVAAKQAEAAFTAAFARMQTELPVIDKKGKIIVRGVVQSTYGKNEDIQEAVKPILQKHGFSLNFRMGFSEGGLVSVTGVLSHEAGHTIDTTFTAGADTSGSKNSIQAVASTQSYGQRYTTVALLNIIMRGVDNDGQTADAISANQAADLEAMIDEVGADKAAFLKYLGVDKLEHLPADKMKAAVAALEKKRKKA